MPTLSLVFALILILLTFSFPANSELSVEEIIKGRKAIFSKNYKTAKRVQALSSKGDFEKAKKLMLEMSDNYKSLLKYFPANILSLFLRNAWHCQTSSCLWRAMAWP